MGDRERAPQPADPSSDDPCDESGVDRTLVRWFLSLTPYQRLEALDGMVELYEIAERSRGSAG